MTTWVATLSELTLFDATSYGHGAPGTIVIGRSVDIANTVAQFAWRVEHPVCRSSG